MVYYTEEAGTNKSVDNPAPPAPPSSLPGSSYPIFFQSNRVQGELFAAGDALLRHEKIKQKKQSFPGGTAPHTHG